MQHSHGLYAILLRSAITIIMLAMPCAMCAQFLPLEWDEEEKGPLSGALISAILNEGMGESDSFAVKRILRYYPALIDSVDAAGKTPLHIAVDNLDYRDAVVRMLLDHGARVDARDHNGRTPLFSASTAEAALLLVEKGADVNARDIDMKTPLFSARFEVAQALLGSGADPLARAGNGATVLHYTDDPRTVDLLLARGADINGATIEGMTPLHYTVRGVGREYVIMRLIERGASVGLANAAGNTPLHMAVQSADSAAVTILLRGGADPVARNKAGQTPLHLAAYKCRHPDALRALLAAHPSFVARNTEERTPLEIAIGQRNSVAAVVILDAGFPISTLGRSASEEDGWEPPMLVLAAGNGDTAIMAALLRHGADVNVHNRSGVTPLHVAADGATVRMLLDAGAGRDIHDSEFSREYRALGRYSGYMTPIERAVAEGREGAAVRLLEAGADPNSALELAATRDDTFWISLLRRYGAAPTAETLKIARRYDNDRIATLLETWIKADLKTKRRR